MVPRDKFGYVTDGTGDYHGNRGLVPWDKHGFVIQETDD